MNALTKRGIARAREGDWKLLDSLEVVSRARGDWTFAGILHPLGCKALVAHYASHEGEVYSEPDEVECPFCEGSGDVEVMGANGRMKSVTCPECDGEGVVATCSVPLAERRPVQHDHLAWFTLSGDPVDAPEGGALLLSVSQAEQCIALHRKALEQAEQVAA